MKIFAGPRGSGRTTALVRWCQEDSGRILVIQNEVHRLGVQKRARRMAKPIGIVTVRDINERRVPYQDFDLAVDDYSEMMWSGICITNNYRHRIGAIALTSEDFINLTPPASPLSDFEIVDNLRAMESELRG